MIIITKDTYIIIIIIMIIFIFVVVVENDKKKKSKSISIIFDYLVRHVLLFIDILIRNLNWKLKITHFHLCSFDDEQVLLLNI
jgi:hypothetical protein